MPGLLRWHSATAIPATHFQAAFLDTLIQNNGRRFKIPAKLNACMHQISTLLAGTTNSHLVSFGDILCLVFGGSSCVLAQATTSSCSDPIFSRIAWFATP
jgi:hypothetical protein